MEKVGLQVIAGFQAEIKCIWGPVPVVPRTLPPDFIQASTHAQRSAARHLLGVTRFCACLSALSCKSSPGSLDFGFQYSPPSFGALILEMDNQSKERFSVDKS